MVDVNKEPTTMEQGNYVLMRKLTGVKTSLARLRKGATINVDNLTFKADGVIGKPFGVYVAANGVLGPEPADVQQELEKIRDLSKGETVEGQADQVGLVKDKVKLKKANKAQSAILVEKVNTRLLADYFYHRNPETVGYLRPDLASQILHASGIKQGDKVLIYDQCQGVMTAYVVERLGGQGACVVVHNGPSPSNITCVHNRQFPLNIRQTLLTIPIKTVVNDVVKDLEMNENLEEEPVKDNKEKEEKEEKVLDEEALRRKAEYAAKAAVKQAKQEEAIGWINGSSDGFGSFDCLLVITKNVSPVSVLNHFLEAVRSSGTVVVYSPYQEEIAKAKFYLDERDCVFSEIRSTKAREIQVLPKRTHPLMQQYISGGFYLSTVKGYNPSC